ncbi:D-tyrosyl-tRNA(Tyr) deacylase [Podila epigama]|nr:D-tyrosyl-tRNA(Tyr) deacylase [Podila epigama]
MSPMYDVWMQVLLYLDLPNIMRLARVSKNLYSITKDLSVVSCSERSRIDDDAIRHILNHFNHTPKSVDMSGSFITAQGALELVERGIKSMRVVRCPRFSSVIWLHNLLDIEKKGGDIEVGIYVTMELSYFDYRGLFGRNADSIRVHVTQQADTCLSALLAGARDVQNASPTSASRRRAIVSVASGIAGDASLISHVPGVQSSGVSTTTTTLRDMLSPVMHVLQRVVQASVEVNGKQISKIKQGLCVLIGLSVDDTTADVEYMVRKLLSVRVFDSNQGPVSPSDGAVIEEKEPPRMWAKSVVDIGGEILCVSQFTLYGQVIKGSKPDFHLSMKSETSKQMYHDFLERLKKAYSPDKIKDGEFGAMMLVNIANDGPVTLELDSRKFEYLPVTQQNSPSIAKALKYKAATGAGSQSKAPKTPKTPKTPKEPKEPKQVKREEDIIGDNNGQTSADAVPNAEMMAKMELNDKP